MSVKQVILIRRDLKMRRGKEISQACHASSSFLAVQLQEALSIEVFIAFLLYLIMGLLLIAISQALAMMYMSLSGVFAIQIMYRWGLPHFTKEQQEWLNGTFTKITLQVDSEEELVKMYDLAKEKGLTAYLITDSGKTEFSGVPTRTAVAIGPNESSKIDEITGGLKTY